VKITEFGNNDGTGSQLTSIYPWAFFHSGEGIEGAPITSITFNKSINSIDMNAF
jgi:hypothetical protein